MEKKKGRCELNNNISLSVHYSTEMIGSNEIVSPNTI